MTRNSSQVRFPDFIKKIIEEKGYFSEWIFNVDESALFGGGGERNATENI